MRYDKFIVGKNVEFSMDTNATGVNNNVCVIGSTGSGKTVSVVEPRMLETYKSSLVVSVTKRKLVHEYAPIFKARGYKVLDLDFSGFDNDFEGIRVGFDPMKYIGKYSDIAFLAESIIMTENECKSKDPYWDEAGKSLLISMIGMAFMIEEDVSFSDVINLINRLEITHEGRMIRTNYQKFFDKLQEEDPNNYFLSCWKTFAQLPEVTASCIFSVMNNMINTTFPNDLLDRMVHSRQFDIRDLADEKIVLFITTSSVDANAKRLVNIFYSTLFRELVAYGELLKKPFSVPVHIICDDFATGGRIAKYPELISMFRAYGISSTILVQSLSQLEEMYETYGAKTIMNNCDNIIYLGGMDLDSCTDISKRVNRPLEDVLYMPVGKLYAMRRGNKPIYADRIDMQDLELKKRTILQVEERMIC